MGNRMHHKTSIYLATLIAAIALSACGSKKTANGGGAPAEAKTTTTGGESTSNGGVEVPPAQGDGGTTTTPDATTPPPGPGVDTTVVPMVDPTIETAGYDPVDPKELERTDLDKRYTGMEEDGLYYTGSSTDALLTYLRLRNDDPMLNPSVREANRTAAQSIKSARLVRDKATGDILVVVKVREGYDVQTYVLGGGIDTEETNSVGSLRLLRGSPSGVKTTGTKDMEGKVKCLDLDGGCETTFVRLVIGTSPFRSAVAILFRESLADVYVKLPAEEDQTKNEEFQAMAKFWKNSINDVNSDLKMKEAVLKSFEVVNGRSGFDVQIKSINRQLMAFGGPLLAPDAGSSVKFTADRAAELKESIDLDGLTNFKYDLANYIGDAKIVNNNGLGQVRMSLKMRKRTGYAQDQFLLTVMRIIKPTVTPNEDNLRLN